MRTATRRDTRGTQHTTQHTPHDTTRREWVEGGYGEVGHGDVRGAGAVHLPAGRVVVKQRRQAKRGSRAAVVATEPNTVRK